ncbi:MAG: transposase [Eubacterium sp.]|nr:transposase [Eubacterium sp.]
MEVKKCPNCGGDLNYARLQNKWVCPYCDATFDGDANDINNASIINDTNNSIGFTNGFNNALFSVETDFKKLSGKKSDDESIKTMNYCINDMRSSKEVENYLKTGVSITDDLAVEGKNEELIINALPKFQSFLESGEKIILYCNKAFFSKVKEFFILTNKRTIFVEKSKVTFLYHKDLVSLSISGSWDSPIWKLNGDYNMMIISVTNGQTQGAIMAYICLSAFESDVNKARIRIL